MTLRPVETYRRDRGYQWNYDHGPRFAGPFPEVPATATKDFFGFAVGSRVGIAAGLLLNARWIECYARLGFDVLTYKTVRSAARPCYPPPNWVLVDAPDGLDLARDQVLRTVDRLPPDVASISSAVCFGMPSQAPPVWRADVAAAKSALGPGQVLVVSVVGTPADGGGEDELAADFARCARWAAEAGADLVEANFSCPNVVTAEGSIYEDPAMSGRLARAVRDAVPSTPLLIKSGHFGSDERAAAFYRAVDGAADGVVLVNGIARRVVDATGAPVFGRFERVGVLGRAIHGPAVRTVDHAVRLASSENLGLGIVAVGGVMAADDPAEFFAAGARGVVLGGAPMFDPHLAVRIKRRHPEW